MGFFTSIIKYLLFAFNVLIVICAIVLITFGGISLANEDKGLRSITEFSIGGFAIAVGLIIFIIASFGCWGAIKQNSCLLTTYAAILIVLLILQIVLGALAFVAVKNDNGELNDKLHNWVSKIWDDFIADPNNASKWDALDNIQKGFQCCGVDGWEDYTNANVNPVPGSCCSGGNCNGRNFYDGCAQVLADLISANAITIGGIAIAFGLVELIGAIFAFIVRNKEI